MPADPADVEVLVGLEVSKGEHHGTAVDAAGETLLSRTVRNEQAALEALLEATAKHGTPALVIDQPGSIVAVAYIPGLVMRRAADLYPGEAKTDARDSYVVADTARVHYSRIAWLEVTDEVLEQLRVLSGHDDDLAADVVRVANRLRDTLTSLNPALERVVGHRLGHPAVRALLARYPGGPGRPSTKQIRV